MSSGLFTPNVPGFHKYGTRRLTRKHTDLYGQVHHRDILKHRWEHWREADRKRMLHLTNDRRFPVKPDVFKKLFPTFSEVWLKTKKCS